MCAASMRGYWFRSSADPAVRNHRRSAVLPVRVVCSLRSVSSSLANAAQKASVGRYRNSTPLCRRRCLHRGSRQDRRLPTHPERPTGGIGPRHSQSRKRRATPRICTILPLCHAASTRCCLAQDQQQRGQHGRHQEHAVCHSQSRHRKEIGGQIDISQEATQESEVSLECFDEHD